MNMTKLKLKPGRYGLTRNGEVTGKLRDRDFINFCFTDVDLGEYESSEYESSEHVWRADGTNNAGRDLIALIPKSFTLHDGGPNPAPGKMVKVMFGDGSRGKTAGSWWKSENCKWGQYVSPEHNIIAYRVKREKKPTSVMAKAMADIFEMSGEQINKMLDGTLIIKEENARYENALKRIANAKMEIPKNLKYEKVVGHATWLQEVARDALKEAEK